MTHGGSGQDASAARRFWSWFKAHSAEIAGLLSDKPSRELTREISVQVSAMHEGLGWEVGPGIEKTYQFVISPNHNRERLKVSRAIVEQAPDLADWEFVHAKPPKSWNLEFDIVDAEGTAHVNCRGWQYRLTGFDNNLFFDVDLYPDAPRAFKEQIRKRVGVLLVEGEIGEELFIERIDRVTVHSESASPSLPGLTPIVYLHQHLLDVIGDA